MKNKSKLVEVFSKDIDFGLVLQTSVRKPLWVKDSNFKDKQEFINAMEEGFLREYDIRLKVIPNSFDIQIKGGVVDCVLSGNKRIALYYRLNIVGVEFKLF